MGQAEFFGVRHHSPTAARIVAERIRRDPPDVVLIEGPSEFNSRIDELALPHELPIMIYSWAPLVPDAEPGSQHWAARRASFYPLTDFSPEWTALQAAHQAGVDVRFIDLPWLNIADIAQAENRYAEGGDEQPQIYEQLQRAFRVDSIDALFDEMLDVDPQLSESDYLRRIELSGELLRSKLPDEETRRRETFMATQIRHAVQHAQGTVLVVCGAAHVAPLRELIRQPVDEGDVWRPPAGDERYGIALSPTSYLVLDALDGYNAGQPSPGFYDALWHDRQAGRSGTVERMLAHITQELRDAKQFISPADLIATLTTAGGLAQLRGHKELWRTDLIDGMIAALIKDDAGASHPLLRKALDVMRGTKLGRLAEGTPQPPLAAEIRTKLMHYGLELQPGHIRDVEVDLTATPEMSHLLHSLWVLDVPVGEPRGVDERGVERWHLRWSNDFEPSIVMNARYGATLEAATTAKLLELVAEQRAPARVAEHYVTAIRCGIARVADTLQQRTAGALTASGDVAEVGRALAVLMEFYRYEPLHRAVGRQDLGAVVEVAFDRILRLIERLGPQSTDPSLAGIIDAIRVATDTAERVAHTAELDVVGWDRALQGTVADDGQAPGLRGAALGGRWVLGAADDDELAAMVRLITPPSELGEFTAGLLTVAREAVLRRPTLVQELDRVINDAAAHDFLAALPGLRRAFSRYPPRERSRVAQIILGEQSHVGLAKFTGTAAEAADVAKLEADLAAVLERFLGVSQ